MDEPINKKIYITKMTTPFSKQLKTAVQQKLYSKVQQAAILFDQPVPRKTTSMKVLENKLQKVFKDNNINSIDELDRLISVRQSQLKNQLDLPDSDQSDLISLNRKVTSKSWIYRQLKQAGQKPSWKAPKEHLQRQLNQSLLDRDIEAHRFQDIFNRVIQEGITLTDQQAQNLWNTLVGSGRYYIHVLGTGINVHITTSNRSKPFLIEVLTNGLLSRKLNFAGDYDKLDQLELQSITSMELTKIEPKRKIQNRDGGFFPYINTTDLDLSRYQIYNQDQAYNVTNREHCLIHTLDQQGVPKDITNRIKLSYVKGVNIRKKDLNQISKIIERNIETYTLGGKNTIVHKIVFDASKPTIKIAIYQNHYFTYEPTIYSKYSILHYDDLKNEDNFENIIKKRIKNGRVYLERSDTSKVNSLLLVDKFFKQGQFQKLDLVKFEESGSHVETREHIYLENIEKEQRPCETPLSKQPMEQPKIWYADCETFVNSDDHHKLYLLGFVDDNSDIVELLNTQDDRFKPFGSASREQLTIWHWIKTMTNHGKNNAICYFHNLKYDYHVLEKYLNIKSRCEKDGQFYNVKCSYKGRTVELRDSYKLIPFALSKFGEEFELPTHLRKREAIAYTYYTHENNDKRIPTEEYRKLLKFSEVEIFDQNVKDESSYRPQDNTFNPTEYYKQYLRLDCLVLKKGLQKFASLISEITENKMSVYDCLTISSLTDKYMKVEGAYDGVFESTGNLRNYIAQAVYGGRVACNDKYQNKVVKGPISDFDGVSLYPSAINRLCREKGLPTGPAQRFEPNDLTNWESKTYAILTVKINKVNKIQQIPFIAVKSDDTIQYVNEAPKEPMVIDSVTLRDWIDFHQIEYELQDGVFWNQGGNPRMGDIIQRLFGHRLRIKKTNKALANTIKLMLNSSYGKTIIKKTNTEKVMVKTHRWSNKDGKWDKLEHQNLHDYVYNNFNTIQDFRQLNEHTYEVQRLKADRSYNRGQIGAAILSYSKRIMNEVFDVANDNDLPIYYTDTDSLHCNFPDVEKIEKLYHEKYQKNLVGKQLEQFHTDFTIQDPDKTADKNAEIYATESIFLGKKSYMDKLISKDTEGNDIVGYHIRLKGITQEGLLHAAKTHSKSKMNTVEEQMNGYWNLYNKLAKGEEIKFVLNPLNEENNAQKVLFEFKDGQVFTKKEFIRKVKFT